MSIIPQALNTDGLIVGLLTFIIIGIYHPLVIKGEYYFGVRIWIAFLIAGIAAAAASLCVADTTTSTILGVIAFSSLWSIKEVFDQRRRVSRGWFPQNPARANHSTTTIVQKTKH